MRVVRVVTAAGPPLRNQAAGSPRRGGERCPDGREADRIAAAAWQSRSAPAPRQPGAGTPVTGALGTAESTAPAGPGAALDPAVERQICELYSAHYQSLVRLAALLVRDAATAEEVVQDAFLAMHVGWRRLRDIRNAPSYLRQSVVNRSRSVLRHRAIVDKYAQKPLPDEAQSAEQAATTLLERSAVVAALRGLSARQREVLVLRYYADLSEADIAKVMGISRGTVKCHTARGMSLLRAALEEPP